MSYLRSKLMLICLLTLCVPIDYSAAELFSSQQEKAGFLKALSKQDVRYDPAEQMIRRPFSSPGYHTTLKSGYVHPPRDSLNYAVALLDSGDPDRCKRAQEILRKVISLQDQKQNLRNMVVVYGGTARENVTARLELGRFLRHTIAPGSPRP